MKVDTQRRHSTAPGEIADAVSPLFSSTEISPDGNRTDRTSPPLSARGINIKTFQAQQKKLRPLRYHLPKAVSFASLTNPLHLLKWFQRSLLLDEKRAVRLYVPDCPFYFFCLLSQPVSVNCKSRHDLNAA